MNRYTLMLMLAAAPASAGLPGPTAGDADCKGDEQTMPVLGDKAGWLASFAEGAEAMVSV